jgi:hypothetical protein
MTEERLTLTPEHAMSLIADGDSVHTFRNPGPSILVGAEWDRSEIERHVRSNPTELGGERCREANHGIVVHDKYGTLFIATREGIDWAAEEAEAIRRRENPQ